MSRTASAAAAASVVGLSAMTVADASHARFTEQTTRLRISNGCVDQPMWIAHMAAAGVGPDPQNVKVEPLSHHDFAVPPGLSGTRYWPKLGCDEEGNKCHVGESGGPQEHCSMTQGCAPPVDSKFEASFGMQGADWVDISLVDGWTLPFRFDMYLQPGKTCGAGDGDREVQNSVDCSGLSMDLCPLAEDLGAAGAKVDLRAVHPRSNLTVGCYSPCSKLTFRQWSNNLADDRAPWDDEVKDYCCPTPPESPKECREGPVGSTGYVQAVHDGCPGVYGYAYDDGMGLIRCPDDTKYHVTFYCMNAADKATSTSMFTAPFTFADTDAIVVRASGIHLGMLTGSSGSMVVPAVAASVFVLFFLATLVSCTIKRRARHGQQMEDASPTQAELLAQSPTSPLRRRNPSSVSGLGI